MSFRLTLRLALIWALAASLHSATPAPAPTPVSAAAAADPNPRPWPDVKTVADLYLRKNYGEVLRVTNGLVYDHDSQHNMTGAELFYYRGDALFRAIYQSRANQAPEAETPLPPQRASFEISYQADGAKALETALADLKRAMDIDSLKNGSPVLPKDPGFRQSLLIAHGMAALEKALFVTQVQDDFFVASQAFSGARRVGGTDYSGMRGFDEPTPLRTNPHALAGELSALMARGDAAAAKDLFVQWRKDRNADLLPDTAVAAYAAAFDLVGEYEQTRALLMFFAFQQIKADGGKFNPANHAAARAAMKAHLANLNYALAQKAAVDVPPLRRSRVAGALVLRGDLTAEERAYIVASPELKGFLPLRALRVQLESPDTAGRDAARARLERALKSDAAALPALALRGHALLQAGEVEAAVIQLSDVIKRDPFLAVVLGATRERAAAYTKLGRAADAADDLKLTSQFEGMLAALAQ